MCHPGRQPGFDATFTCIACTVVLVCAYPFPATDPQHISTLHTTTPAPNAVQPIAFCFAPRIPSPAHRQVVYLDSMSGRVRDSALAQRLSVTVVYSLLLGYQLAVAINLFACAMVMCAYFQVSRRAALAVGKRTARVMARLGWQPLHLVAFVGPWPALPWPRSEPRPCIQN